MSRKQEETNTLSRRLRKKKELEPLIIKASKELRKKEDEVRRMQDELVNLKTIAEEEATHAEDRLLSERSHRADDERGFRQREHSLCEELRECKEEIEALRSALRTAEESSHERDAEIAQVRRAREAAERESTRLHEQSAVKIDAIEKAQKVIKKLNEES